MRAVAITQTERIHVSYQTPMEADELARRIQIEREHEALDRIPVIVAADLSAEARKQTRRTVRHGQ